ncbi:glutathione S-transferase C-terminal domain-containing protein [Phytobacter sp. V91]|uniref:glutathione S-transferase C-terminal domain-containing protein n=1 Tax=Phytobacter sp. V91 TaxID=3369425 RepID=UPI003F5DF936
MLGVKRLNNLYRNTVPGYQGRGTVPAIVDLSTGKVVNNDYHTLPYDLHTAWAPLHSPTAPDLYPHGLRPAIDLLYQQIFDDVNNGPYKILFAGSPDAARVAKNIFEARLADYDQRLASRRYLFGAQLTDSDVRLFQTLLSYDRGYRPGLPPESGTPLAISSFPHLWAYARELFSIPGFADEAEKIAAGVLPEADGTYRYGFASARVRLTEGETVLTSWQEPHHRETLRGSPLASGPGGAGTEQYWSWLASTI